MTEEKEAKDWMQQMVGIFEQERKQLIPPNVLVVGKTGVGKSTLVNAMFGEDLAATGIGQPVSKHLQKYSKAGVPIHIWDSRGLELEKTAQTEVREQVKAEIRSLIENGEPHDQLHVCWYCINDAGDRIEETEIAWVQALSQEMPVVLVLTKTLSRKKDDFYQSLLAMNLPVKQIVRVLAAPVELDEGVVIPIHGLKELCEITFQLLPEQLRKGFAAAQKVDIEKKARTAWKEASLMITGSGAAAALPPGADILAVGTLQIAMLSRITHIFGLQMGKQFFLSILSGIGARLGVRALAGFLFAKFAKLTGVGYLPGAAIDAALNSGVAYALASAYINVCKRILEGQLSGMTDDQISQLVHDEFERKSRDGNNARPDNFE